MMERMTGEGNAQVDLYTADDERLWTVDYSVTPWRERFYLRDLDGKVLRVVGTDGGHDGDWFWVEDYVHRGGALLASWKAKGESTELVHFHLDHLGSPRIATDGSACATLHTYWPFGEELLAGGDEERMKFTGVCPGAAIGLAGAT